MKFYVIDSKQNPILSGKACQALNLVQRVHQLDTDLKELLDRHPDLENASGAMPGTYSIKIDPTAKTVVHGPRRQPAALPPKIVDKLKEMEKGHLAKVMQPTDWVNSMVVSSRGEKIRICLDPADLNKVVKREHYPIPTVEEIVAKIPDTTVFTVLDVKSGYLQMKLDYESSLLTTVNTPIGRYRWLKPPFGIKSALEMYQRAMDEMLEGIDHAYAIIDDMLVAERDITHHDSVLEKVLYRAKSYNLKLNFDKVRVRKQQVPYVGYIMSAEGLKPDPEKVRAMKEVPPPTTKEDVRRFLGSIHYQAKFLPMLEGVETPLRELTKMFSSTGARPKLKHSNGSEIYVAQRQYWHTTMLRKKQPYNVTLARMQSARPVARRNTSSLRFSQTSQIRAQLGAHRERNVGDCVQSTQVQRIHPGESHTGTN